MPRAGSQPSAPASRPTAVQRAIPWSLVLLRVLLTPVAVEVAASSLPRWVWLLQGSVAALSDIYDGVLARRWGVVSPGLRQADSVADTIYALGVCASLVIAEPAIFWDHAWGLGSVVALEALRYPLDWARFNRGASYHSVAARLFGIALIPVTGAIMFFGWIGPFLWIALAIGIYSELEGIAISLVLPRWTHDVPHLGTALALRRASRVGS